MDYKLLILKQGYDIILYIIYVIALFQVLYSIPLIIVDHNYNMAIASDIVYNAYVMPYIYPGGTYSCN